MKGIWGRILRMERVDGTNAEALRGVASGELGHGDVVTALEQTAGRGRRGGRWSTSPGLDLACSMVLCPENLPAMGQFLLAKAVAVAVRSAVQKHMERAGQASEAVRIKWPNDILLGRDKVAGILVENELRGGQVSVSVIGVGINVNGLELEEAWQATSLLKASGTGAPLATVLQDLLEAMAREWWRMTAEPEALARDYSEQLWARGRFTEFELDGRPWRGRALEVDRQGRLVVESPEGSVEAYGMDRLRYGPRN